MIPRRHPTFIAIQGLWSKNVCDARATMQSPQEVLKALLKKMTLKRRRHASDTSGLEAFWPWELDPMTSTGNDPSFEGLWFNFRGKCLWNFPMPFFRGNCLSKFPNDLLKCIASLYHCQNASRQFVSEACLLSLGVILAPGCPRPPREGISNGLWFY